MAWDSVHQRLFPNGSLETDAVLEKEESVCMDTRYAVSVVLRDRE